MELMDDASTIERKLFAIADKKRTPLYGVLELTPLCNMNCDMCYVRLDKEEMDARGRIRTLDEWLNLAKEMKDAGTLFVLLTGGEPLLYPYFKELYLQLRKLGMVVTVNTNGTLINEEWVEFFKIHKPRRINITLYGADDNAYTNLCHNHGGFNKTINAIKMLKENKLDVKINGSLVKANADDCVKIIDIGKSMDIPVKIDTYMYPAKRERIDTKVYDSRLDPISAANYRIEILKKEIGEDIFKHYLEEMIKIVDNTKLIDKPKCMSCKAGKSSFVINWQGMLRPCIVMDSPERNAFEIGFRKAWEEIVKEVDMIRTSSKCNMCKFKNICNNCAAATLYEEGSYEAVPDYICQYTQKTYDLILEEWKKYANK